LAPQAKHLVSLERLTDTEPPYFDTEHERPATRKGYAALMGGLAAGRKKLDLSGWNGWHVDDSGLKAFAKRGEDLASLEELNLSWKGDEIGDEGVRALLRQARHLGNLQVLDLARTAVSDGGAKVLAD